MTVTGPVPVARTVAALVMLGATGCTSPHHATAAHELGVVSGRVIAEHGAGPVSLGRGPVAATVLVDAADGNRRSITAPADGLFSLRVPAGRCVLGALISDGTCRRVTTTISEIGRAHV